MKILWIVNIMFPDVCMIKNIKPTVIGGWMHESAKELSRRNNNLTVVTTHKGKEIEYYKVDAIEYYLIPSDDNDNYNPKLEKTWSELLKKIQPDAIHIHGTEYSHGLSALRVFSPQKTVVSIQGLLSVYSRYFYAGISTLDILKNITLRDVYKGSLFSGKKQFVEKGKLEKEYIQDSHNIIGRTLWDYSHVKTVNPDTHYHFCNETLRKGFYTAEKWSIQSKENFRIFLSQANYPIKGIHKFLEAVGIIVSKFPNVKVKVGGLDIVKNNLSFKERLKITGYGKYVKSIIQKYKLENNVEFLGLLSEEQMIHEYQKAHVFVCPSSIENSPNSVGEAQILGVPVISSYVGGVSDMVEHDTTGLLYRFEEVEILAQHLIRIFENDELALKLSENGIDAATKRHDLKNNIDTLEKIYNRIIQ
jgi:glycosyltransferase involved in cell wall biosynthesis